MVFIAVLLGATVLGWVALPAQTRALFTPAQVATLALFVLAMIAMMLSVALSSVRLDAEGLTIRNGLRTHRLEWASVRGFRFTADDPWAFVLLHDDDPDARPMMALQRIDGERSRRALRVIEDQWRESTGAQR